MAKISDKTMEYIAIGSGVAILAYLIFNRNQLLRLTGFKKNDKKDKDNQNAEPEYSMTTENYTVEEYKSMANALHDAFNDGWRCTTDEEAVYKTLRKVKNKFDWEALKKAFGNRSCECWWSGYDGNITKWLKDDLTTEEYGAAKAILNQAGVTI